MTTNQSQHMGPSEWIPLQTVGSSNDRPEEQTRQPSHSFYQSPTPDQSNPVRYPEMGGFQMRHPQQIQSEPLLGQGNELQLLEKKYQGFYHYSIVNIAMIVITILVGLFEVFVVIAHPRHKDDMICKQIHNRHQDQVVCMEDPNDFFTDRETERFFIMLFVLFIIIVKTVQVAVYYAGKYAYDLKSVGAYKILLIIYGVFLVLSVFSLSLFSIIIFGYLTYCAYKMKETLERIEAIRFPQMRAP